MYPLVQICRPAQWVKNLFVFLPLVFSKLFLDIYAIESACAATLLFCIASSATYILNDLLDIENDKRHPVKSKKRPLASGTVTKKSALILLGILYISLIYAYFYYPLVVTTIALYILINYTYTFFLKNRPVFDVFIISSGFVLRVYAGGIAIGSGVSQWMFIVTLCLALYLASIKRRQELLNSGPVSRSVLNKYSVELLTQYAEMSATCTVVFYSMFVALSRPELVSTIPLMLFGLYRYWYCVDVNEDGESPTDVLLEDRVMQGTILIWISLSAYILYSAN